MTVPQKFRSPIGDSSQAWVRSGGAPHQLTDRAPMLTIPEVASTCRISQTSVRRAIAEGELEAIKVRSRIRITREAFNAWLASQQRPATRPKPDAPCTATREGEPTHEGAPRLPSAGLVSRALARRPEAGRGLSRR